MRHLEWTTAPLVALDLEGTGSQDRDAEAILEIGLVPMPDGRPDLAHAYHSLVNPGRRIPRRPWISPGLTNDTLAEAPAFHAIAPELTARLDGVYILGHNVQVDWRLLSRHCTTLRPAGLIDTLKLARAVHPGRSGHSLTALLHTYDLHDQVSSLVPGGQAHRALWDAAGAALLLPDLIHQLTSKRPFTVTDLLAAAAVPLGIETNHDTPEQICLL
ncbi:hypothetical protein Skr01_06900 [Sphaerisporangium krabiense]|uniref:DNA polymerase III epsilon subunit-like protein n=1 Tax=Sphaerisporangium krabiense TaxID=763782 RepID=A0A7W8ZD07_9ACTN|nr:3'-5' exonuclease [Sphaerisporangium krabiense]MBB5631759.1 DNA polymerase III epsilon subunit-like protein [Sphaerisporangium krabiense]GII60605.1 hypothetical protein Skr01_06900 [Sphaerisporangium krabiense]